MYFPIPVTLSVTLPATLGVTLKEIFMGRIKINDSSIVNLPITGKDKRYFFKNDAFPGFGIKVTARGKKQFIYKCIVREKQMQLSLGYFPAINCQKAIELYNEYRSIVQSGGDPKDKGLTVNDVFRKMEKRDWEEQAAVGKPVTSTIKDQGRNFKNKILPAIGTKPVKDVKLQDLEDIIHQVRVKDRNPSLAVKIHNHLTKLYNFSERRDYVDKNLGSRLSKPATPPGRTNFGDLNDLKIIWNNLAVSSSNISIQNSIKLVMLTGLRVGAAVSIKNEDINTKQMYFTVLEKGEKRRLSKDRLKYHLIPLTEMMLALFSEVAEYYPGSPYAFPQDANIDEHTTRSGPSQALKENFDNGLFEEAKRFTNHDLRRTMNSVGVNDLKIPNFGVGDKKLIIDKILSHKTKENGRTGRPQDDHYDMNSYREDKKKVLDKWDEIVLTKVNEDLTDQIDRIKNRTEVTIEETEDRYVVEANREDEWSKIIIPRSNKVPTIHAGYLEELF